METELIKFETPELQAVESSRAEQIRAVFIPMADMLCNLERYYVAVMGEAETGITKDVTVRAKRLRLDIAKVRVQTEKARKVQKKEYLIAGKAIDGVSNILKWATIDKETKLKEVENFFEIQEQKRLDEVKLQEERRAESERLVLLEKENAEREKKEKEEREAREQIKKENEQLKQEMAERDLKETLERAERMKAETEKKDAKNDTEKVIFLVADLENLKTKYVFNTDKNIQMYSDTGVLIDKIVSFIECKQSQISEYESGANAKCLLTAHVV